MVSIIVETNGEYFVDFCKRVNNAMVYMTEREYFEYEILVVNNFTCLSINRQIDVLKERCYPISLHIKPMDTGLLKIIKRTQYDTVLFMNMNYLPDSIPHLLYPVMNGKDMSVGCRRNKEMSIGILAKGLTQVGDVLTDFFCVKKNLLLTNREV